MEGAMSRTPRRLRTLAAAASIVVAAGLGVASCDGGDDTPKSGGSRTGNDGTEQPTDGAAAKAYIGLPKKDAIARAKADDRVWRVTREDDETYPTTLDYDPDRLNFEIDDGRVTKATFG